MHIEVVKLEVLVMVAFTPPNTIRGPIDLAKDSLHSRQQKGVYSMPYSCSKVYIGDIGRLKKPAIDISKDKAYKSTLA
jgi:hypothetical protein